ncbi:hypothetical protein JTY60_00795 [symbiont of Argiope bruennichi]|uniref:hypothetical protein n=1 Tax=symbiont of Argiope bruennichi TaxID=2810479 RepID=UPI003DA3F046
MSEKIYVSGDKPGIGKYKCIGCPYIVEIISDDEELEACPMCGIEEYIKVE